VRKTSKLDSSSHSTRARLRTPKNGYLSSNYIIPTQASKHRTNPLSPTPPPPPFHAPPPSSTNPPLPTPRPSGPRNQPPLPPRHDDKKHIPEVRRRQPTSLPSPLPTLLLSFRGDPALGSPRFGLGSDRGQDGGRKGPETGVPRRDCAALMMVNTKSSFQSERGAGGDAITVWDEEGSVGRVGEVGGFVVVWGVGGRVVRVGLGGRCSFSFASTYTKQNSTPGDDGRSKKPNLQAADGIWPTL
jgi:hypothetical protein